MAIERDDPIHAVRLFIGVVVFVLGIIVFFTLKDVAKSPYEAAVATALFGAVVFLGLVASYAIGYAVDKVVLDL